jgi:hypothetical protein
MGPDFAVDAGRMFRFPSFKISRLGHLHLGHAIRRGLACFHNVAIQHSRDLFPIVRELMSNFVACAMADSK